MLGWLPVTRIRHKSWKLIVGARSINIGLKPAAFSQYASVGPAIPGTGMSVAEQKTWRVLDGLYLTKFNSPH
jgi:hypothetical protein